MDKILILSELLLQLLSRAQTIQALISKARSENRDVTDAELDALGANDDAVRSALQAEIDKSST